MHCPNCGTPLESNASFCPNCGTRVPPAAPAGSSTGADPAWQQPAWSPASATPYGAVAIVPEDRGKRVLAYLIDLVPMLLLSLLHLIPVAGWMLYGLVHAAYWLLRDINGSSPGKIVMGSVVGNEAGGVSTTNQRILRNVPLALPGLLGLIPLIGWIFEFGAALSVFGIEAILLLTTGRRLGDRIAQTNVFRK